MNIDDYTPNYTLIAKIMAGGLSALEQRLERSDIVGRDAQRLSDEIRLGHEQFKRDAKIAERQRLEGAQ